MYTTDGAGDGYLRCGSIEDAYITVDFGPGANITKAFNVQRHFQPHGPLVNSEFYPGTVYNFAIFLLNSKAMPKAICILCICVEMKLDA